MAINESSSSRHPNDCALSDTRQQIATIWTEVLQCGEVTPTQSFFELGGDSLTSMLLMFRISDELHVDLSPGAITEHPTLDQFCTLIDQLLLQSTVSPGAADASRGADISSIEEEGII